MSGGAGAYLITVNSNINLTGTALGNLGAVRMTDGTNFSVGIGTVSGSGSTDYGPDGSYCFLIYESTSFSAQTFQLQGYVGVGTEGINVQATGSQNTVSTLSFDVMYFPTVGGGGSGIARSVNLITGNTTGAAVALTDYVYMCGGSGGYTFTLPTAVGSSNLYTVKNNSTGIISIATTSAQTIDGASSDALNGANLSRSYLSDGSNWHIISTGTTSAMVGASIELGL